MHFNNFCKIFVVSISALTLTACKDIFDMGSMEIVQVGNKTFVVNNRKNEIMELLPNASMRPTQEIEHLYLELNYDRTITNSVVNLGLMITSDTTYWHMRIAPNQSVVLDTLPTLELSDLNAIRNKLPSFISDEGKKILEEAFIVIPETDYLVFKSEDEENKFRASWAENIRQDGNRLNLLISPYNSPLVLDDHRIDLSLLQTRRSDSDGLAIEWSGYGRFPTQLDPALVQRFGGQNQLGVDVTFVLEI